jgi:hypothetical protein
MARRTHLKAWDKRLLERIQRGRWSVEELQWVLSHLDERTPTLVIQKIHARMHGWQMDADRREETTPWHLS